MMQTPVIVTFANQKGGVGKTSLCVTFANYLVTKGVRVFVVDCDYQRSIIKCRKVDCDKFGSSLIPYEVEPASLTNPAKITEMTARLHNDPSIEVVLVDSPGSLASEGIVALFANSDIIVVPFHYDVVTVSSTAGFLQYLDCLSDLIRQKITARIFIVPNLHDHRVGRRSELLLWEAARETFMNYGIVTPKITRRADMERFSTIAALDRQTKIVAPVFDLIYHSIFDTKKPIRQYTLSGIQLTEIVELMEKENRKKEETELDKDN